MSKLVLVRYKEDDFSTLGKLFSDTGHIFDTLEPPWKNNEVNISCIPTGRYNMSRYVSSKFGECFQIYPVSGRTHIRIHSGNYVDDTTGCILVGKGLLHGKRQGISNSKIALRELSSIVNGGNTLEVIKL